MYNNFQEEQKAAQAQILNAYSDASKNLMIKSQENDIEKGGKGEGSRGGKVIGHTKSGKAIYDVDESKTNNVSGREGYHSDFVKNHKNFTSEDHKDAHEAHLKQHEEHGKDWHKHYDDGLKASQKHNNDEHPEALEADKKRKHSAKEQDKHAKLADWHKEASEHKVDEEKYGKSIGQTSSGKHVHKNKEAANYGKDFSDRDHKEAAEIHKKHEKEDDAHGIEKRYQHLHRSGKTDEEKDGLFDAYIKEHKANKSKKNSLTKADFDNDIEKGGEGSKGGKVIGHTKSGKAIYDTHDHKNHKDFSKHDHKEAADLHDMKSREHWDAADDAEGKEDTDGASEHETKAKHHDTQWQHHNSKSLSEKQLSARKGDISKADESDIQKGGEGSKGGKIVGHTKSGKAIYDSARHEKHSDFSKEDHKDASDLHNKLGDEHKETAKKHYDDKKDDLGEKASIISGKHYDLADTHKTFAKATKKEIKKSDSGVAIGTISPDGKFIKSETGWNKVVKEVIEKSIGSVAIGTVSPDGKFQKGADGWNKIEK